MTTPPLPQGLSNSRVNRVANTLHSAAIHLLRRVRDVDRQAPMSPERLSVLSVLVFAGPKSVSALADAEGVSRPAISRMLNGLEDSGLVTRERAPSDRRSVHVKATVRGRRLMQKARKNRVELLAEGLAHLDPAELTSLEHAAAVLESLGGHRGEG
jgi:DNA-binding MarR family transcriptional regulator